MARQRYDLSHEAAGDLLYFVGHPDPDHYIAGDTDFYHETPVILFQKNSTANTRRTILKSLWFGQLEPVASSVIRVGIWIDPLARFSSGGALLTPTSVRPGWTAAGHKAAEVTVYHGSPGGVGGIAELVATGLQANTRKLRPWTIPASGGNGTLFEFEGELYLDRVGSILIYVWTDDVSALPITFDWSAEFVERTVTF